MRLQLDMALVRSSLGQGVAVTRQAWKKCPGILILMLVAILGADYLDLALANQGLANFGLLLLYNLASIAAYGAVFRLAAGVEDTERAGLCAWGFQWRALEGRLLGAAMLLVLLFIFAIVLVVFLLLALGAIIAYGHGHELTLSSPAAGGLIAIVSAIAAFGGMLWVTVRLSLCGPMTFAERKIVVFRAWAVSRGHFWQLLGSYALALAMGIVAALMAFVVFIALAGVLVVATGGAIADVGALFRPDFTSIGSFFTPAMILYQVFGAVITAVYYAVILAPQAMAYVALTDYAGDTEG